MTSYRRIMCLSFGFLIASSAFAKVYVAPLGVDSKEFAAAMEALPKARSFIDHYEATHPPIEKAQELHRFFAIAQASFISLEDQSLIRQRFEDVLKLEHDSEWKEEHLRIFYLTYLRLLQLTPSEIEEFKIKRRLWLEKAALYMDEVILEPGLIPPPILEEVHEFKIQNPLVKIEFPKNLQEKFPKVWVNGKLHSTHRTLTTRFPKQPMAITFLSNQYQPMRQIRSPSDFSSLDFVARPFVRGSCENLEIQTRDFEVEIYRPLSCREQKLNLNPLKKGEPSLWVDFSQEEASLNPSYKNWVWIGLGAVATALLVHQTTKKKSEPPSPTESYGF